jgi:hypothetical protein
MVTKSGKDTLSTLQNILTDIDSVSEKAVHPVSKHILINIVSTMSDRPATQKKFNSLLAEYKQFVVSGELGNAWFDMSYAEQMAVSKLNNFFVAFMPWFTLLQRPIVQLSLLNRPFLMGSLLYLTLILRNLLRQGLHV